MILAFIDLQVTQMLPYQASSQFGLSVQEKTFKITIAVVAETTWSVVRERDTDEIWHHRTKWKSQTGSININKLKSIFLSRV